MFNIDPTASREADAPEASQSQRREATLDDVIKGSLLTSHTHTWMIRRWLQRHALPLGPLHLIKNMGIWVRLPRAMVHKLMDDVATVTWQFPVLYRRLIRFCNFGVMSNALPLSSVPIGNSGNPTNAAETGKISIISIVLVRSCHRGLCELPNWKHSFDSCFTWTILYYQSHLYSCLTNTILYFQSPNIQSRPLPKYLVETDVLIFLNVSTVCPKRLAMTSHTGQ